MQVDCFTEDLRGMMVNIQLPMHGPTHAALVIMPASVVSQPQRQQTRLVLVWPNPRLTRPGLDLLASRRLSAASVLGHQWTLWHHIAGFYVIHEYQQSVKHYRFLRRIMQQA